MTCFIFHYDYYDSLGIYSLTFPDEQLYSGVMLSQPAWLSCNRVLMQWHESFLIFSFNIFIKTITDYDWSEMRDKLAFFICVFPLRKFWYEEVDLDLVDLVQLCICEKWAKSLGVRNEKITNENSRSCWHVVA